MNIAIVGSGNVAHYFAFQFASTGHKITAVISKTLSHAQQLAAHFSCIASISAQDIPSDTQLVCLCLPDDAIAHYPITTDAIVVHHSGTVDIEVLAQKSKQYGCLWPVASINKQTAKHITDIPICIRGNDNNTMEQLVSLCSGFTNKVVGLSAQQQQYAHVIATIGNNFNNYMLMLAQELCYQQNLEPAIFTTLFEQPLQYFQQGSNEQYQTGAARRGDKNTILAHQNLLESNKDLQELYTYITNKIIKHYSK